MGNGYAKIDVEFRQPVNRFALPMQYAKIVAHPVTIYILKSVTAECLARLGLHKLGLHR